MLIGNLPAPELLLAAPGFGIAFFCVCPCLPTGGNLNSGGASGGVCCTPVDASNDALVFLLGGGGKDDDGFKPVTGAPLAFGGRDTGLPLAFAFASAFGSTGRSSITRKGTLN